MRRSACGDAIESVSDEGTVIAESAPTVATLAADGRANFRLRGCSRRVAIPYNGLIPGYENIIRKPKIRDPAYNQSCVPLSKHRPSKSRLRSCGRTSERPPHRLIAANPEWGDVIPAEGARKVRWSRVRVWQIWRCSGDLFQPTEQEVVLFGRGGAKADRANMLLLKSKGGDSALRVKIDADKGRRCGNRSRRWLSRCRTAAGADRSEPPAIGAV